MLLTDLILGRKNPWSKLYDPSRVTLRATGDFLKENLNVASQYTDWARGGDVDSYDQIAPGTGAVIRRGMAKIAVYRDDQGDIHERSAVCTHLYCIVDWNSGRAHLGLSLSRLQIRSARARDKRTRDYSAARGEVGGPSVTMTS